MTEKKKRRLFVIIEIILLASSLIIFAIGMFTNISNVTSYVLFPIAVVLIIFAMIYCKIYTTQKNRRG